MSTAPLMLSVSGLRGLVGSSLTPPLTARYAAAFGQWLQTQHTDQSNPPHVVLGRDSRGSGQMVEMAAASGLIAVGCRVTCLGIAATPSVAIMAEHLNAQGGMVITASHNPIIWNGIKALRHDGVAPPPDQAAQIIAHFNADDVTYAPVEALQPLNHDDTTHRVHVDRVLAHIDADAIRKRKPKVVLDSVHGAGGPAAAMLLKELGVEVVHLYAETTGQFPHTPEPTRDNLVGLTEAVREHGADIGFAQDPDADRLALVDDLGRYIGEEYTLALTALHVLGRDDRPDNPSVAANLSTSRMIDDIAEKAGATVTRTAVGEANVADAMRSNPNTAIGGEGNGGVIWPRVVYVRDSISGIALMLELLAKRGEKLSRTVDTIPSYAIVKEKLDLATIEPRAALDRVREHFASQKVDDQDGVRVDWPDRWVHARASNTEPILRIIAEATSEDTAKKMIAEVRNLISA